MEFNFDTMDFFKSYNYDVELHLTKEAEDLLAEKVKAYVRIISLYTSKVSFNRKEVKISYVLPILNELDYLTKGIAEFFIDSYVKEVKVTLKDSQNNPKVSFTGLVTAFEKPDWYLNLFCETPETNQNVELVVTYPLAHVSVS